MPEILIVDDQLSYAEKVAELIEVKVKLEVAATDSPAEALRIVRENPVRVAVLDQRMPEKSGTDLFRELRQVRPELRGVMLTGEATPEEVGAAMDMDYSSYLTKAQAIQKLPQLLIELCVDHELKQSEGMAIRSYGPLHVGRRKYFAFGPRVNYFLSSLTVIDENFVDDTEWETIVQLSAGEKRTFRETRERKTSVSLEDSSEQSNSGKLALKGVPVKAIEAGVESKLTETAKTALGVEVTNSRSIEGEYHLDPVPQGAVGVQARNLQRAPLYKRVLAVVESRCENCSQSSFYSVTLRYFTGAFSTRHEDFLSDNTRRVMITGLAPSTG